MKPLYKYVLILVTLAFICYWPTQVIGSENIIQQNGSSSSSEISISSTNDTNISQINTSSVTNQVDSNINTGENVSSSNQGSQSIQTGNISSQTNIISNINSSQINSPNCCLTPSTNQIIGNGQNSQNSLQNSLINNQNIIQTNNTNIKNNIIITANTGNNQARSNNNDSIITTGNINIKNRISNSSNLSSIKLLNPQSQITNLTTTNGTDSTNKINSSNSSNNQTDQLNNSNITNYVLINAQTGENISNSNIGNSLITSGDIYLDTSIVNNTNTNLIDTNCCHSTSSKQTTATTPLSIPIPATTTNNGTQTSNIGISSFNPILWAAIETGGNQLPTAGNNWTKLLTLDSLLSYLSGLYLSFHPGIDPGIII